MEKFNPHNPKYKRVEDLPEEHRKEYVNIPEEEGGGFVRAEALKAYEWWEQKAAEINQKEEERKQADEAEYERKSWLGKFFHQVYLPDRATFLDFARAEAGEDFKKELEYREKTGSFKKFLLSGFINIFERELSDFYRAARSGYFTSVISEDRKGRMPAEIMQKFLNKVYRGCGRKEIKLYPFKLSRSDAGDSFHRKKLIEEFTELFRGGELGEHPIYVTEYISTGATLNAALEILDVSKYQASGHISSPISLCVTLGGECSGIVSGRQGEHGGSNVYAYKDKESPNRGRIIEEISDALVARYEKWADAYEKSATMRWK